MSRLCFPISDLVKCTFFQIWLSALSFRVGKIFENIEILIFFLNTLNCFVYIIYTKYCLEAVLYSKRTARYPISPHTSYVRDGFKKKVMEFSIKLAGWVLNARFSVKKTTKKQGLKTLYFA